jgi:hypothetical protein
MTKGKLLREILDLDERKGDGASAGGWGEMLTGQAMPNIAAAVRRSHELR